MSDKIIAELMKAFRDQVIDRMRIQKALEEAHVRFQKAVDEGRDEIIELSRQELMAVFETGLDKVIAAHKNLARIKALQK